METAARTAVALAERINSAPGLARVLLNVNAPDLPPSAIAGIKVTRLARTSHINTVEEGDFGRQKNFHLIRQPTGDPPEKGTDIYAKERGFVSITPLFTSLNDRPPRRVLDSLCADLLQRVRNG
jgi:5'-nucleotidase